MLLKTAETPAEIAPPPTVVAELAPSAHAPEPSRKRRGYVEVYDDPRDAESAWADLEATAPASLYQTRRWLIPWLATIGKAEQVEPFIAVAYDQASRAQALFPFVIGRKGFLTLARFAGGGDSNANMALIRPGTQMRPREIMLLLRTAAAGTRHRPDAFVLSNQAESFGGAPNPLAQFPRQPSPSFSFAARLEPSFDAFAARQMSSSTRKKLRKKRDLLGELGPVEHRVAASRDEGMLVLDAFFTQKLERFRDKNIDSSFEQPESRAFLETACLRGIEAGRAAIELHALKAGERIVAVYGGGAHQGRFCALFNSFDFSPEVARSSPGELLLMAMLEQKCAQGLDSFDLGIGEARYKASWCDLTEPRFDLVIALTARGHAFAALERMRLHGKRTIKQNPKLWALAQKMRAGI